MLIATITFLALLILKKKQVSTCDPLPSRNKANINNVRKWISKSMSFIDYFATIFDGTKEPEDSYFSSENFNIDKDNSSITSSARTTIYFDKDISSDNKYKKQTDDYNCGVYALWYLLMQVYNEKNIVECDPSRFRDQLLLYII